MYVLVVSVDPGKSSGAAVLSYGSATAAELIAAYQVYPGVNVFRSLVSRIQAGFPGATWIAEKFSPRPNAGFGQGLDSTIPLVCEGVLIDRDLLPEYATGEKRWVAPVNQYVFGGRDKASKKRAQHAWLKANGFYVTGGDLDAADADDARSAIAHGLSYLMRVEKHRPTFEMLSKGVS